jgi:hypothetical protein
VGFQNCLKVDLFGHVCTRHVAFTVYHIFHPFMAGPTIGKTTSG